MTRNTSRTSDDPALDPRVRALLAAAGAPVDAAGPAPGEEEALEAFRTSSQSTRKATISARLGSAKTAVAAALGTGVVLAGGVGAAAAGVLPGPAQETVGTLLETVGISVPAGEKADENGDPQSPSERSPLEEADETRDPHAPSERSPREKAELPPAADHGERVSGTARNSTAEGADKGKEIAEEASEGRVESGDRGSAGKPHGARPADKGRATADESSDRTGRHGSGNRPTGR